MRADALPEGTFARRDFKPAERNEILRICERWGWREEAVSLGDVAVEQEVIEPCWPA
jgi:hypothetical protein